MATSATGGYLAPALATPPLADAGLDAILQKAVVGITGLAGSLVRPRWQPGSPKHPEPGTDWCAIGVGSILVDAGPAIEHDGAAQGQDRYARHEEFEVLATFYGPGGQANALRMRDGLAMPQNMEALKRDGVAFIEAVAIRPVPELLSQQWVRRYDLLMRFRRDVRRQYAVLNLQAAQIDLADDTGYFDSITIQPEPNP